MQLSLIYLVAVSLAMTVMSSPVQQYKPLPALATSKCTKACLNAGIFAECGGFKDWKVVASANVPATKGTTVTKVPFYKKDWWFKPTATQPNWYGGHVYDDGSMTQWVVGGEGKDFAVKYQHNNYYVIYWQKGQEKCYAPHQTFQNFDTFESVSILAKP